MNRVPKFKAFDKVTKTVCDVWTINWKAWRGNGDNINSVTIELHPKDGGGTAERMDHEVELMQYTGVKDKNGEDIYEGHIVAAWSQGSKGIFEIKWRQEANPCWLLYPNGQNRQIWHIAATEHKIGKQFIGVDTKITTTDKEGFYDDGLEIIGNIYQNPELLNNQ